MGRTGRAGRTPAAARDRSISSPITSTTARRAGVNPRPHQPRGRCRLSRIGRAHGSRGPRSGRPSPLDLHHTAPRRRPSSAGCAQRAKRTLVQAASRPRVRPLASIGSTTAPLRRLPARAPPRPGPRSITHPRACAAPSRPGTPRPRRRRDVTSPAALSRRVRATCLAPMRSADLAHRGARSKRPFSPGRLALRRQRRSPSSSSRCACRRRATLALIFCPGEALDRLGESSES